MKIPPLLLPVVLASALPLPAQEHPVPTVHVAPFLQQVHEPFTEEQGLPSNQVLAVEAVGEDLYALTESGLAVLTGDTWRVLSAAIPSGEAVVHDAGDRLVVANEHGLHVLPDGSPHDRRELHAAELKDCVAVGQDAWLATARGVRRWKSVFVSPGGTSKAGSLAETSADDLTIRNQQLVMANAGGLYQLDSGQWSRVLPQSGHRSWAPVDVRAVEFDEQGGLWFACPQGVGYRGPNGKWQLYDGHDGLPSSDFTCLAVAPGGTLWLGTPNGAICFLNGEWRFRNGLRWLLDNRVNDIAVMPNGDAWVATPAGLSCIRATTTTLSAKAQFFEDEIDRYHRRTPFGYVANASMDPAGDKSTARAYPTDNDGQYTGMYTAAECFGYGATGDPARKERARAGFEAIAFLSEVTQGGRHPAPPGFIARAIMPVDGPDPNEDDNPERDRKKRAERDGLWKVLDPRWPVSADGKWYWKTDSSSDELDGHYFAYGLYYDLVAETDAEKERCRQVVRRVTDHLMSHNYRLVDHDGTPTRWAHFAPEDLNHDPNWWAERGLNSLSVLTYLSVAHHVTGDQKYRDEYLRLALAEQFALNGMTMPKLQFGPGSHVQFDDQMAFMNFYHLIRYETDPRLLRMYFTSIYYYWNVEKYELNPFFNFVYAACCHGKVRTDQWGDLDLTPGGAWLQQSVDTLKAYPLDLINWPMDHRHRIDLARLGDHTREPGGHIDKGYRRSGYVLPIDERQALSWSEDAWVLNYPGEGKRLRDGRPYLLAWYMGLYHGYITE